MYNYNNWIDECDPYILRKFFNDVLKDSGFGILSFVEYHFEPFGYTSLWLLSESHFAIHTFPEENKTYIELSSCVEKQYKKFIELNEKRYRHK